MVQQTFREFDSSLHAAGKLLNGIFRAICQSNALQDFHDPGFESWAAQSVEVSLVPKVLVCGEFWVVALRLEYDADMTPESGWVSGGVKSLDNRAPARRQHECRENSEQGCFSAAIRAEKPKKLSIPDLEGDAVQGSAILITMDKVLDADDCGLGARDRTRTYGLEKWDFRGHRTFYDERVFSIIKANSKGR